MCHLVGNLCRHSSYFYSALLQPLPPLTEDSPLLSHPHLPLSRARRHASGRAVTPEHGSGGRHDLLFHVISACEVRILSPSLACLHVNTQPTADALDVLQDEDPATRKFACFAVGNSCFHSSRLYPALPPAIPVLLALLQDKEQKTRANAAGALGNLVRNGGALCDVLVRHGVPDALMLMASGDPSLSARRIALFSIGNLAVYSACRAVLMVRSLLPRAVHPLQFV